MDTLKYIVTNRGAFAVFNNLQAHNEVARSLHGKPVGAGFCRISVEYINPQGEVITREDGTQSVQLKHYIDVKCFGESLSLGIKSREKEDEEIIRKAINNF